MPAGSGRPGNPPSLDIQWTTASVSHYTTWHMYETLFTYDSNYAPVPLLVDTYTVSDDQLVYTFRLRQGVKFHNGKETTSEDVVGSLRRWGARATHGRTLFASVESLEATDRYTVSLRLTQPVGITTLYLSGTQVSIYPREVVDAAGDGEVKEYIGTGP